MPAAKPTPVPVRAAQYLRMSTDQQRYSLDNQSAAIAAYAEAHGLEIARSYVDAGVSGLRAANRAGLRSLLADVVGGGADYEVILVYDISRWGRFQNPDEGAHYEFICRKAGVRIEYCAEDFPTVGVTGALLKQVKRVMAAEYSARLSAMVSQAQARTAGLGYWVGGDPGYGLRRCVLEPDGRLGAVLEPGDRGSLQGRRVVLAPGPPHEVAVVREIYQLFLESGLSRSDLVRWLNDRGVACGVGRLWTYQRVHHVLTSPYYAGTMAAGRTRSRLKSRPERRPKSEWIRCEGAFAAIVSAQAQTAVAEIIDNRQVILDDETMLARLADLLARTGKLSAPIIKAAPGLPCPASYHNRFGSLSEAYRQIGYDQAAGIAAQRAAAAKASASARRGRHAS